MTKQFLLLVLVLVLGVIGAMGQTPDFQSWQRYTVEDREFAVSLPIAPVLIANKTIFEGKTRGEEMLKASADGVVYRVDLFENRRGEQKLRDFIKELTRDGWDLTTERSITVDGVAGKEYVSQSKQVVAQFFSTKRHLYRFATSGALANDARVSQFFSSIALGERADGIKIRSEAGTLYYREELDDVYRGKDVERKARLLSKPEPNFPPAALDTGARGRVTLTSVFSASGRVVNIKVVFTTAGDDLTEAAIEAARKIRFEPAMKNGKPVSMLMQLEYNFNL